MEGFIRRLSRVADFYQHQQIHQEADEGAHHGCRSLRRLRLRRPKVTCPQGHVPVYVGDEMERFAVPAELLNRPAFAELLDLSAREYGYDQRGVLRIPCPVPLFRRLLAADGYEITSAR